MFSTVCMVVFGCFLPCFFVFVHDCGICVLESLRLENWVCFQWCAGWFLGAYFLGGFGEDGRGMNGLSKGVVATAKSWAVGIPVS